ncbi:MAG: hypothetical protein AB7T06_41150 [Kofleriaceae bacterium]
MADFVLLGADTDETRILRDRASGYSVALVGHPSLAPVPEDTPRYDVVVTLADVKAEHGFRIDVVPSSMSPQALAVAFATAYANTRAKDSPQVLAIAPKFRPTGTEGGAMAQYRLRGDDPDSVEQVWIATKPSSNGVSLYHTTRCNLDDVNPIKWFHLRSACMGQHQWSEPEIPRAPIWPNSEMATPTAKLDLTEPEWAEAAAKAREMPELTASAHAELIPFFTSVARTDNPPATELHEKELEIRWGQLSRMVDPAIAHLFLRNLSHCKTALDLRAWAWQCVWAIGNRNPGN